MSMTLEAIKELNSLVGKPVDYNNKSAVYFESYGYLRHTYSYNKAHYRKGGTYDYTHPVYVYALTERGSEKVSVLWGRSDDK